MKITQQRDSRTNTTVSTMDIDTFVQKIKTETKTKPVSSFREQLRYTLPGTQISEANKPAKIMPAAEFRKVDNLKQLKTYNGIVELTVGPLSGRAEAELVKRRAWEQPQTRLAFLGSSGRTVKIWTTFYAPRQLLAQQTRGSGTLPCPRLPSGGEVLPASTPLRHPAQRTGTGAILTSLIRPGSLVPPRLHPVLPATTRFHARRADLPRSSTDQEVAAGTRPSRLRNGKHPAHALRSGFEQDLYRTGRNREK